MEYVCGITKNKLENCDSKRENISFSEIDLVNISENWGLYYLGSAVIAIAFCHWSNLLRKINSMAEIAQYIDCPLV